MKTSNFLLTGFIASITLYLVAAFTEVRISGIRNSLGRQYSNHSVAVEKFQSLDATNIELHIRFDAASSLTVSIEEGQPVFSPEIRLQGDTLVLRDRGSDAQQDRYDVTLPEEGIANLVCQQCRIFVEDGSKEILQLNLSKSVMIRHRSDTARVKTLRVNARDNSRIELSGFAIDTLEVNIDQTQAYIMTSVHRLTGSIRNGAHLVLDDATRINFERDAGSVLHFRR
jgi:hypothetical protein